MRRPHIVRKIQKALEMTVPSATVILYGSEARCDARQDSDIDLLILLEGDSERVSLQEEDRITTPLFNIELETGTLISPRVLMRHQWENRLYKTPYYVNVMNEGVHFCKSTLSEQRGGFH